jgi:hypothetical protein
MGAPRWIGVAFQSSCQKDQYHQWRAIGKSQMVERSEDRVQRGRKRDATTYSIATCTPGYRESTIILSNPLEELQGANARHAVSP